MLCNCVNRSLCIVPMKLQNCQRLLMTFWQPYNVCAKCVNTVMCTYKMFCLMRDTCPKCLCLLRLKSTSPIILKGTCRFPVQLFCILWEETKRLKHRAVFQAGREVAVSGLMHVSVLSLRSASIIRDRNTAPIDFYGAMLYLCMLYTSYADFFCPILWHAPPDAILRI